MGMVHGRSTSAGHAQNNRFAVIAEAAPGNVRILQRFASRLEAEAYLRTAAKAAGAGQVSIRDLAAAPPPSVPTPTAGAPLVEERAAYRAKLERERRDRAVSPKLLLAVLLLFLILFLGLGLLVVINDYLLY